MRILIKKSELTLHDRGVNTNAILSLDHEKLDNYLAKEEGEMKKNRSQENLDGYYESAGSAWSR